MSGNNDFGGAFLILLLRNFKEELIVEGTTITGKIPNSKCELNTALRVSADCCNINDCAWCSCVDGDEDGDELLGR